MLFNEPKLLKFFAKLFFGKELECFSALQRAEIAEMEPTDDAAKSLKSFSALQRAEIAEMDRRGAPRLPTASVSVLFNEPKLLKS